MSKKIESFNKLNWIEASKLLSKLKRSGEFFRVDFIKRTDGEIRSMVCRFGVKSELKGGTRRYKPGAHDLLTVHETFIGYRTVPMDGIVFIKADGVVHDFKVVNDLPTIPKYRGVKVGGRIPVTGWGK